MVCRVPPGTEVFAVLGLSGAAVFLTTYKVPLLWLGIAMNLAGVGFMLWEIAKARRAAAAAIAGLACH